MIPTQNANGMGKAECRRDGGGQHALVLFIFLFFLIGCGNSRNSDTTAIDGIEQAIQSPTHTDVVEPSPSPSISMTNVVATHALSLTTRITQHTALSMTTAISPSATVPITQHTSRITPTLSLWLNDTDPAYEVVHHLANTFATSEGISITITRQHADSLRVAMMVSQHGGPKPDMIWGNQDDLAGMVFDKQIQPITPTQQQEGFIHTSNEGARLDGHMWGHPIVLQDAMLMLFNRRLIDAAPKTTNELITLLQSDTIEGEEPQPAIHIAAAWYEARWLLAWLHGFGGAMTTPDGLTPTLNTEEMTHTLFLLRELHSGAPPEQYTYDDAAWLFSTGEVSLLIDGTWAISSYTELSPTVVLGIAPMPIVSSTRQGAASSLGASYVMIPRGIAPEQQEWVERFVTFLQEKEQQLHMAQSLYRLPVYQHMLTETIIIEHPILSAMVVQTELARGLPPTRARHCAMQAINRYLPNVLDNEDEIDQGEAIIAMQQWADACVEAGSNEPGAERD